MPDEICHMCGATDILFSRVSVIDNSDVYCCDQCGHEAGLADFMPLGDPAIDEHDSNIMRNFNLERIKERIGQ